MTQQKHTMGPWRAEIGEHGAFVVSHRLSDGPQLKCRVICSRNQVEAAPDEFAANARLIAAAPDLLFVCELATHLRRVGGVLPGVRELIDEIVREADEAIAKATGA